MTLLLMNSDGLVLFIIAFILILLSPPIILTILGVLRYKKYPENAKRLWLAAVIYLLIGGGICGTIIA